MPTKNNINVLSETFLMDLFRTCANNSYILATVVQNIKPEYLPDRDFVVLLRAFKKFYKQFKRCPSYSSLMESISNSRGAVELLEDIYSTSSGLEVQECLVLIEDYLKRIKFQKAYKEAGEAYNQSDYEKASEILQEYSAWAQSFSLSDDEFTNIVTTFSSRFKENRKKNNSQDKERPVTRFYIDELDAHSKGRNLRTQLTYIMAQTGVGKTHAIRWIGRCACLDGYNVLHIQLEGSKEEVEDAYSASLVLCDTFRYEHGTIRDAEFNKLEEQLKEVSGTLYVKAHVKFRDKITTSKLREDVNKFCKKTGIKPDILLLDSADLVDPDVKSKEERLNRVAVANDLKDLAGEENMWVVASYQATIENKDWTNDEKNVLSEYNCSEAKGLSRPLTHLITLNQSDKEYKEQTMRIHLAKSRNFRKCKPFKIATDYDHEMFYDRVRTMNITKIE